MRILVFQHVEVEHPGVFREFWQRDGIDWDAVEFDAGGIIPTLEDYDALLVFGGPPLMQGLPDRLEVLQWHGAEVKRVPPSAVTLVGNPICATQALRVGRSAYGVQYHVEIEADTVRNWGSLPAYRCALEVALGAGGQAEFERQVSRRLAAFRASASTLYRNFLGLVASQRQASRVPQPG